MNVDANVKALEKACKAQCPNGTMVTSDDFAEAMAKFIPAVVLLSQMAGVVKFAFNLTLYLGEHAYGDFFMSCKMCGVGGHKRPYRELDGVLLGLVDHRRKDESVGEDGELTADTTATAATTPPLPPLPDRWTEACADVGDFKKERLNKQQRNQILRQRQVWTKSGSGKARQRQETASDWISNALVKLVEARDFLADFGLDNYSINSIARGAQVIYKLIDKSPEP